MSYLTKTLLTEDVNFGRRSRACILEQANYFYNDARADMHALSVALLLGEVNQTQSMLLGIANGPGFDTEADNGDGTIDSSKITDEEMLSQCQAIYPQVAALYYDSTGAPIVHS
jgi:hypothetical protein